MQKILLILFFILLAASCEKKVTWEMSGSAGSLVVVEGIITDEVEYQTVRLSRIISGPNAEPAPVTGAEVIVSTPGQVYSFRESEASPGTYISKEQFAGVTGVEHSLLVSTGTGVYTAKAGMKHIGGTFNLARCVMNKETGLYSIKWVANAYNLQKPAMYEVLLDWSAIEGYENASPSETHARLLYYSLPTVDVSEVLPPADEAIYFPAGTLLQETRYSLTGEHAAFLRAMLSETTWKGGYFGTASANIPTNLSQGAVGFFAACEVETRTTVVGK